MKNNKQNVIVTIFAMALMSLFSISAYAVPPANDNFANAEIINGIQVHITRTNTEATKEVGEPNHANNSGGKSVWFKWTAPMSRNMIFTTNRSSNNIDTLIHIYSGTALDNLQTRNFNNDINSLNNRRSLARTFVNQGTTYYIVIDGNNDGQTIADGTFLLDIQPSLTYQGADYDADGMTDFSVFRPSTGTWLIDGSTRSITKQWGTNGDIPVVSSLSNGLNEYNVFRPTTGIWYYQSFVISVYTSWGTNGDIPVPESFGGDAVSYFTVFRPSNGGWYIYFSPADQRYYQFGLQGDIPVAGQYSPDGVADIAVFRPSNGVWYFIKRQSGNTNADSYSAVKFGQQGDKPVPADFDGDGIIDVAVYRPTTGDWWVLRSSDSQVQTFHWGIAEDIPTTGDYDGDGKFDYAVFRPSTATWYVNRSSDNSVQIKQFGQTGDIPMTSNYGK